MPLHDARSSAGKIREFARATMSANPEYLDDPSAADPADVPHASAFWAPPELANRCSPR